MTRRGRAAVAAPLTVCLAALFAATVAAAYSTPGLYAADPAVSGGAGGRTFTGSEADGYTCAVCHQGEAVARYQLTGGPAGAYTSGATYAFELRWPGERVGLTVEATDPQGAPLGTLRAPPPSQLEDDERCASQSPPIESIPLADGRAPLGLSECGATRLRLQWTAPEQPIRGALYLSLIVADGDGTAEGDQHQQIIVPLAPSEAAEGCVVARSPSLFGLGAVFLLARIARRRRRAQRRAGVASLLLALAAVSACARVQPYERGRLAQPDMKLNDDSDLSLGPEHALDYREGAGGGLGGAGGGCGCN